MRHFLNHCTCFCCNRTYNRCYWWRWSVGRLPWWSNPTSKHTRRFPWFSRDLFLLLSLDIYPVFHHCLSSGFVEIIFNLFAPEPCTQASSWQVLCLHWTCCINTSCYKVDLRSFEWRVGPETSVILLLLSTRILLVLFYIYPIVPYASTFLHSCLLLVTVVKGKDLKRRNNPIVGWCAVIL